MIPKLATRRLQRYRQKISGWRHLSRFHLLSTGWSQPENLIPNIVIVLSRDPWKPCMSWIGSLTRSHMICNFLMPVCNHQIFFWPFFQPFYFLTFVKAKPPHSAKKDEVKTNRYMIIRSGIYFGAFLATDMYINIRTNWKYLKNFSFLWIKHAFSSN